MTTWGELVRDAFRHPVVRAVALAALLAWSLSALVTAGIWYPARRRYGSVLAEAESRREARTAAARARLVGKAYRRTADRVEVLDAKLGVPLGQAELIRNLTRLAEKCELTVVANSFEEGKAGSGYVGLSQEVVLAGTYAAVRRFMIGVDQLPNLTVVERVRLERSTGAGAGIRAELKLGTYARKTAGADGARGRQRES